MVTRVSVIGGGIGGLSAAIAFRQIGLDVKVYEQAPALGEVGAGITLWPNAIRVLRKLNLADQVVEKGSVIHRAAFLTWNGKMLSSSNQDELNNFAGEPTVAIHRADLHRILVQALPPETLIQNSYCRAVAESGHAVRAEFDDGHEETADLVVAADGIHSAIRKQLFPAAELRYAGYSAWRGIAHTSRELAQGITSESLGCGSRFGIVPIDTNRVYWFATANSPAGTSSNIEERKEKLLQ